MKFENSLFEERFNDYWNRNVVVLDTIIRNINMQNLFANRANVGDLIKSYQQHVRNMLSNLFRQESMFEDKGYVQEYRKNTIEQAHEDLAVYSRLFPEYQETITEFLNAIDKDSSLKIDEAPSLAYKFAK
ncbi:hypothetical protein [Legionella cherrii]|uniref:Bile acid beta-glucosidase n=1 Tax=Legionella cherrii TaxID=28084 RepID=A0A0W0S929_9GAMM|nr:hypothetical protein [Legionella cherrii]KTC79413.1 bile acid beta-glucosidase [Legionella cherrii]VEB37209.1 bile acid beta-glucosidase [Legionella cherrii]